VRWGALALSTGIAIVMLAIGIAFDALVRDLFARAGWLGWVGIALIAVFVLALLALIARELAGLFRLKRLARLRLESDEAAASNNRDAAVQTVRALIALYRGRPDTANARRRVAAHLGEIMDARDLLILTERDMIAPLDARARALASASARRVSVVTAVSPRAFIDVAFVLWESIRLIRRIAAVYGGRPGTLGLFRLLKAVVSHLAVTGSIAVGDTILQQLVGHGLAGRLSTRLGEGVVNGMMTARIGLSAMDVCRPLPFLAAERPRLKDLAGDLVSLSNRE
jgi:putative membrane protein